MKTGITTIATLIFLVSSAYPAEVTAEANPVEKKILKKLELMQEEIDLLKGQLKQYQEKENISAAKSAPTIAAADVSVTDSQESAMFKPNVGSTLLSRDTLSTKNLNSDLDPGQFGMTYRSNQISSDTMRFGAYGEIKFGGQETAEGWNNGFDAGRVVLLGTYPISENILFNTEIEFEHGGIAKDKDDKLGGSVDIEQVFIDFKVSDYFNWRAPGVDIVPVGYVGLFHEPTQFYSVNRPELYNGLIPSTWFSGATSAYGKVVDNLTYQVQVNLGLEDAGTLGDEPDSSVPAGGYDPGISGKDALGLSRASVSDRKQLANNIGYAVRMAYTPPVIPGLAGSSSVYYTSDTSARGAYGTNSDGSTTPLGGSNLTMLDSELRYRIPKSGIELRAEYVQTFFGNPENLRANNNTDPEDNVGNSMYGYSFEGAYHINLTSSGKEPWELVPFYRYTFQNLQTGGFQGVDQNDPTGAGKQQFHTLGLALFPTPKVVLKLDYQFDLDDAVDSPNSDSFLGAVGWFF